MLKNVQAATLDYQFSAKRTQSKLTADQSGTGQQLVCGGQEFTYILPALVIVNQISLSRMPDFSRQLSKYIPEKASLIVSSWINETKCRFTVARKRKTKLGDYQAPFRGAPHKISVNHDLNPYAFLITTVHEFAHLKTWNEHKNVVKPHGVEWKRNFQQLMNLFIQLDIFPSEIAIALHAYMSNPAASSCTDLQLYRTLRKYDSDQQHSLTVESLPVGSQFSMEDGRIFQIMEKRRTRYKCEELKTGRMYLFHAFAEVNPCDS